MSPYSKSQSVSPRRHSSQPKKSKVYGSSGHRYSYSRSRSISAPPRRPPSPPPLTGSGRRKSSSSRSSSRSLSPPRRSRRSSSQRRSHVVENRCIGVFGLNVNTTQAKIREIFQKYGPIERIQVVIDAQTKRSRGFCFIYYKNLEDAKVAKHECCGLEVDGRRIRVDYSITQRPHTPTPGVYMGRPLKRYHRDRDRSRYGEREHDRYRDSAYYSRSRQPRTPPSPPPSHSCSHRHSRRSHSSHYNERSHRRGYDYSSRSRSRSHTPRKRSRY